jgi:hypothetical protein
MTIPENSQPVTPPVYKRDSSLAIASLVCGLLTWSFVPFFGAIAAIITGHVAKKEIRESGDTLTGDGMALTGLILGYTQLGLIVLGALCLIALIFASAANTSSTLIGASSAIPEFANLL